MDDGGRPDLVDERAGLLGPAEIAAVMARNVRL
jgi:hypothetical protein